MDTVCAAVPLELILFSTAASVYRNLHHHHLTLYFQVIYTQIGTAVLKGVETFRQEKKKSVPLFYSRAQLVKLEGLPTTTFWTRPLYHGVFCIPPPPPVPYSLVMVVETMAVVMVTVVILLVIITAMMTAMSIGE